MIKYPQFWVIAYTPFAYGDDKPKSGIGVAVWAAGEYQCP